MHMQDQDQDQGQRERPSPQYAVELVLHGRTVAVPVLVETLEDASALRDQLRLRVRRVTPVSPPPRPATQ